LIDTACLEQHACPEIIQDLIPCMHIAGQDMVTCLPSLRHSLHADIHLYTSAL